MPPSPARSIGHLSYFYYDTLPFRIRSDVRECPNRSSGVYRRIHLEQFQNFVARSRTLACLDVFKVAKMDTPMS